MNVWLSPEILDRPRDPLFHQATPNEDVFFKPYELLKHAQKRIFEVDDKGTSGEEAFALGEAVAHLRGAIEHRQKQIVKKFNLSKLSVDGWPVGRDHDKLSELHVMRPLLVKKLIDLRNFVIHEQKYPHNDEKHSINELFEFTWYFIRTTDAFLSREISGMILYPDDLSRLTSDEDDFRYDGCFLVEISPRHEWRVKIKGYGVPINLFSKTKNKGWLELVVNEFSDFEIYEELNIPIFRVQDLPKFDEPPPPPREDMTDDIIDEQRKKRYDKYFLSGANIKSFEGTLIGPSEILKSIVKEYFTLFMFY